MAYVLAVSALKFGDPVADRVLMESHDSAVHETWSERLYETVRIACDFLSR
jgi:hypothetical protein